MAAGMIPGTPDRERGSVLVEFALVVPILLVIFAGIVDFSLMMQRREVVTNAAREGARLAVLPGYVLADVQSRVNQYLDEGIAPGAHVNAVVTRTPMTISSGVGPPIEALQIDVAYDSRYSILGPMMALIGGSNFGTITLRARSTMRKEW